MFSFAFSFPFSMDDITTDIEIAASLTLCAMAYNNFVFALSKSKIKKRRKARRWWATQMHRNRTSFSLQKQLDELVAEPSGEFKKFTRMSTIDFENLLNKITPLIIKQDTQLREAVPARTRFAITLRYLATGDSFQSLHFLFKVSPQLISTIVPEVCAALNNVLKEEIKMPSSAEEWLEIENGFRSKFPRAIGAIDGKHIVLICPTNSGSEYFNYKKTFCIVLMALVNSKYQFIFADIGGQGRISDGGIFRNTVLWEKICNNSLNLPSPHPLPNSIVDVPYVFLGDGAFALGMNIMKPYPGNHDGDSPERIFNKKLSSARVIVENTFGILSAKFRIFKSPIELSPEKASVVTMSCILLHNYLKKSNTSTRIYCPPGTIDVYDRNGNMIHRGSWRSEITSTNAIQNLPQIARRSAANARQVREEFKNYFFSLR